MEVRLLMHRPGVTCEPGTSLRDAARRMEDEGIGSLLVVDHHGALAGIVTDRDITLRAVGRGLLPEAPIESVMSPEPTTVHGYDDAFNAATLMATKGCRRLPVLDHDGHLEGVIALDDLVILFTEQLDKLVHTVALEQTPPTLKSVATPE
jgi:signal-transduction protein with cAMP-binding, CBS, and nucleotidyltransferase domain